MWQRDERVRSLGDVAEKGRVGRMVAKGQETLSKAAHISPAFVSSLGFNLDTDKPTHFHVDGAGFGHSVVQYGGSW